MSIEDGPKTNLPSKPAETAASAGQPLGEPSAEMQDAVALGKAEPEGDSASTVQAELEAARVEGAASFF